MPDAGRHAAGLLRIEETPAGQAIAAQAGAGDKDQGHAPAEPQDHGNPRVYHELKADRVEVCENTAAKYMRESALSGRRPRPFRPQTTDSGHTQPVAANRLRREFDREKPDTGYVADITYIPTREGWLYLAVVIDLFSRKVVGQGTSAELKANLVIDALTRALERRVPGAGSWVGQILLFHSDRGG